MKFAKLRKKNAIIVSLVSNYKYFRKNVFFSHLMLRFTFLNLEYLLFFLFISFIAYYNFLVVRIICFDLLVVRIIYCDLFLSCITCYEFFFIISI